MKFVLIWGALSAVSGLAGCGNPSGADGGEEDAGPSDGDGGADGAPGVDAGPPCECAEDEACIPVYRRCIPAVPGDVEVTVLDYGSRRVEEGGTAIFFPQVKAEDTTFSFVADGLDAEDIDFYDVLSPTDEELITAALFDIDPIGRNGAQGSGFSVATLLLPNQPGIFIEPGDYTVRVTSQERAADVHMYGIRKVDSDLTRGNLALNITFVAVPGIDSASAAEDEALIAIHARFQEIYQQAGITLTPIRYFDASPDLAKYEIIDAVAGPDENGNGQTDAMDALFASTEDLPQDSVNMFWVTDAGAVAGGVAGGIPGPGINGTLHSGVIVAAHDVFFDATPDDRLVRYLGTAMAHETGHLLGLFHTSERNGALHDSLLDTPECYETADEDDDGLISSEECAAAGGDNLMFPQGSGDAGLTPSQAFVLNVNPLVR